MLVKEKIADKLRNHLINNMGFKANGAGCYKRLRPSEYSLPDRIVLRTLSGELYNGKTEYLKMAVQEDYLTSEIEEKYDSFLELSEDEFDFLESSEEDVCGTDIISEWIWDNVEIVVDDNQFDKYVADVKKSAA